MLLLFICNAFTLQCIRGYCCSHRTLLLHLYFPNLQQIIFRHIANSSRNVSLLSSTLPLNIAFCEIYLHILNLLQSVFPCSIAFMQYCQSFLFLEKTNWEEVSLSNIPAYRQEILHHIVVKITWNILVPKVLKGIEREGILWGQKDSEQVLSQFFLEQCHSEQKHIGESWEQGSTPCKVGHWTLEIRHLGRSQKQLYSIWVSHFSPKCYRAEEGSSQSTVSPDSLHCTYCLQIWMQPKRTWL